MKEKATVYSIIGVIIIVLGYFAAMVFAKQTIDSELIKQAITGLVGFASGAGAMAGVTAFTNSNKE